MVYLYRRPTWRSDVYPWRHLVRGVVVGVGDVTAVVFVDNSVELWPTSTGALESRGISAHDMIDEQTGDSFASRRGPTTAA